MLRAFRALLKAGKGCRWSLYFVEHQRLRYALHENAVIVLLGYVIAQVERGRSMAPEWDLFINFNWDRKSRQITGSDFVEAVAGNEDASEMSISRELIAWIASVDAGWMVPGGKPVFVDAETRKELPLGDSYEAVFQSREERLANIEKLLTGLKSEVISLETVMREVFPRP